MLALVLMVAAGPTASDDFHGWARFSRDQMLRGVSDTVEVATRGVEPGRRDLHVVMRLTRRGLRQTEVLWADSTTCPAVRATVRAMSDLSMPRVASPLERGSGIRMLDGIGYEFDGPTNWMNGRITLSSNIQTPLSGWVDARLAALAPCWKPAKS